jgi:hypothetical protein
LTSQPRVDGLSVKCQLLGLYRTTLSTPLTRAATDAPAFDDLLDSWRWT